MHYDHNHGPIHKSIEALDKMGMDIIETGDPDAFKKYQQEFDNTICGRHPISIFLHVSSFFSLAHYLMKKKVSSCCLSIHLDTFLLDATNIID